MLQNAGQTPQNARWIRHRSRLVCGSILAVFAIVCAAPMSARTNPPTVQVGFTAVIVAISDPALYIPDDDIYLGDTLRGYYNYSLGAPDLNASANVGVYQYTAVPNGITVYADSGWVFRTDNSNVLINLAVTDSFVYQGTPYDGYLFRSEYNTARSHLTGWTLPMAYIQLELKDLSLTANSTDELPQEPPDLTDWPNLRQVIIAGSGLVWVIYAELVSTTSTLPTAVGDAPTSVAWLGDPAPNPFNPSTRLPMRLQAPGFLELNLYDVRGRRIHNLINRWMSPGSYTIEWDGRDAAGNEVASGVYFCRLTFEGREIIRKLTLLK